MLLRELAGIHNRKIGFVFNFSIFPQVERVQNVELPMVTAGFIRLDAEGGLLKR
jgi:ABC-type lipoprotein export system ATPase subunit